MGGEVILDIRGNVDGFEDDLRGVKKVVMPLAEKLGVVADALKEQNAEMKRLKERQEQLNSATAEYSKLKTAFEAATHKMEAQGQIVERLAKELNTAKVEAIALNDVDFEQSKVKIAGLEEQVALAGKIS